MGHDDDNLISRAIDGDGDALSKLLVSNDGPLRQQLQGQIGTPYRGAFSENDVLQVTYLEAFLRIGQFQPQGEGSFFRWLWRIAENNLRDAIRALDRYKRPNRHRQVVDASSDDSYVALLDNLSSSQSTPSTGVARAECRALLDSAQKSLPSDYETVVRLFDLEGLTAPEISERIGRSTGAIYMLRVRAHQRLIEILGSPMDFL